MFVRGSLEAWREYHAKRHEIEQLRRAGADDAELAYLRKDLKRWVRTLTADGRGGPWLIPNIDP
jgi:hypothetical protein